MGEYLIKNVYQLALKLKFDDASNNAKENSRHWRAIWSFELPEKIKIFMWRASNNLLPAVENL